MLLWTDHISLTHNPVLAPSGCSSSSTTYLTHGSQVLCKIYGTLSNWLPLNFNSICILIIMLMHYFNKKKSSFSVCSEERQHKSATAHKKGDFELKVVKCSNKNTRAKQSSSAQSCINSACLCMICKTKAASFQYQCLTIVSWLSRAKITCNLSVDKLCKPRPPGSEGEKLTTPPQFLADKSSWLCSLRLQTLGQGENSSPNNSLCQSTKRRDFTLCLI